MSLNVVNDGPYDNDGNGRIWQRFQLYDISDRIENLYANLKDVAKEYGTDAPDYTETINQIKEILANHLQKVKERTGDWENKLNEKTLENNELKDEIKKLRAQQNNYKQLKILTEGIDSYIEKRTNNMAKALEIANKEKDEKNKQLEQEKKECEEAKQLIEEYKTKTEALVSSIEKMKNVDKYNVENIDFEIAAERDEILRKYNALKVKYQRKEFELDKVFSNKLNKICDEILNTKTFDAEQCRLLWKKDLDDINNIYKDRLKKKDSEWQKAKDESIKTLDQEYKHLENQIKQQLQGSLADCRTLKSQIKENKLKYEKDLNQENQKINHLKEKIDDMKVDYDGLQKRFAKKTNELNGKHQEMMTLQTQLSKYKILWQHFFGLDESLRNEIDECNAKLSRFERRHNINSNVARKKRKVVVNSLSEWYLNHQYPPLMIDNIPLPSDKYRRFDLFNYSKDAIKLKGFSIKNQDGIAVRLDEREIRPNGYIMIALKARKKKTDITVPDNFKFNFGENEKLYLCDTQNQEQIFPNNPDIFISLKQWKRSPLSVVPFGNRDSVIHGFIIENVTGRPITLINHYFTNKYQTFKEEIPNKRLGVAQKFRLITIRNDNPYEIGVEKDDIVVKSDAISDGNEDDALLICDQYQQQFVLYELGQLKDNNHNISSDADGISAASGDNNFCFVM